MTLGDASTTRTTSLAGVDLKIERRPGADDELVEAGRRYWAADGVDEFDQIVWLEKTTEIETDFSHVYIAAAAGVIAEVADVTCENCGVTPWLPRTRSALQYLVQGRGSAADCVACNENLKTSMARELDPANAERRKAARVKRDARAQAARKLRAQQAAEGEVRAEWDSRCRAAALETHPLLFTREPDWTALHAAVEIEAAVLACLRYATSTEPISPIQEWERQLAPDEDWARELIVGAWRADILSVYPDSDVASFVWEPTFKEAIEGSPDSTSWGAVLKTLPHPSTNAIYVPMVCWYVPHGPSLGTAPKLLDDHLAERLDPAHMPADRQEELLALVSKLIALETVRYFDHQLEQHNMPRVPENHRPRLVEAAEKVAQSRSLGDSFSLVWRSVKSAAAMAQAKSRAPKENMTTYGVNQFEEKVQRALADLSWSIGGETWHEDNRMPLSALTRTVLMGVLDSTLFQTSRPMIEALLPSPVSTSADDELNVDEIDSRGYAFEESQSADYSGLRQLDPVVVHALRTIRALPRDLEAQKILMALNLSKIEFLPPPAGAPTEDSASEAQGDIHPEPESASGRIYGAIEGMYRVGLAVEAVSGDAKAGLLAACAAASCYPTLLVNDQGGELSVGAVVSQHLIDLIEHIRGADAGRGPEL